MIEVKREGNFKIVIPPLNDDFDNIIKEHADSVQLNKNNIMDTWLKQTLTSYLGKMPSGAQINAKGEIIEYHRQIGQFSRYELKWENKVIGSLDMAQVMGAL